MKIPVLEGPSIERQAQPIYQPNLRQTDRTVSNAFERAGAQVAQTASQLEQGFMQHEAKAKQEANAVVEANAMLDQDARAGATLSEFRKLKGLSASEQRAKVLESLDKDRNDIAGGLADLNARNRFLVRSSDTLRAYRHQVESHTGAEFETAQSDVVKGRTAQFLAMTEGGVENEQVWETLREQTRQDIRNNSTSPPAADAALSAFDSSTAESWTRQLLAQGHIEEASKYAKANQAVLGGRFVETSNAVAQAEKGAEREMAKAQATRDVAGVLETSKATDGYLDESKAVAAFSALDPEQQERARPLMQKAITMEAQRKKADVDSWKKSASGQLNNGGYASIDGQTIEKLNTYEPDYLRRLKNEDELRQRRARARATGTSNKKAEAANDKLWITRFKALGSAGMSDADVDDFVLGHGLTPQGLADISVLKTRAGERVRAGVGRAEDDLANDVDRAAAALIRKTRTHAPEITEDERNDLRAQAADQFEGFVGRNKRAPDQEERTKIISDLLQSVDVKRPRKLLGIIPLPDAVEKKRAFQVAPDAPAKALSPAQQQALDWANANPNDQRAAAIKKKLGVP